MGLTHIHYRFNGDFNTFKVCLDVRLIFKKFVRKKKKNRLVKEIESAFKGSKMTKTYFWQKLSFFNLRIMLKSQYKPNKYQTSLLRVI